MNSNGFHPFSRSISLTAGLVFATLTGGTQFLSAETIFYEDFSSPTVVNSFPYVGRTGDDGYTLGQWVASNGSWDDNGVTKYWGSVIEDGVAKCNTFKDGDGLNRGIAIVLDFDELTGGEAGFYTLSFVAVKAAGSVQLCEIENLGEVFINTADMYRPDEGKSASMAFEVKGDENTATTNNLLNAGDSGWATISNLTTVRQASVDFYYDGDGDLGLAFRSYASSLVLDNVEIRKKEFTGTKFTTDEEAQGTGWMTKELAAFASDWTELTPAVNTSEWITSTETGFTFTNQPIDGVAYVYHTESIAYDVSQVPVGDTIEFSGLADFAPVSGSTIDGAYIFARFFDASGARIEDATHGDLIIAWNGTVFVKGPTAFVVGGTKTEAVATAELQLYYEYFSNGNPGSAAFTIDQFAGHVIPAPEALDPEYGDKFTTVEDAGGTVNWSGDPTAFDRDFNEIPFTGTSDDWVGPTRNGFVVRAYAPRGSVAVWHTYERSWEIDGNFNVGDIITFTGSTQGFSGQPAPAGMYLSAEFLDADGYEILDYFNSGIDLTSSRYEQMSAFQFRGKVPEGAVSVAIRIYYFDNRANDAIGASSIILRNLEGFVNTQSSASTWHGYTVDENGWVDTESSLGRFLMVEDPWIWSEVLGRWIYLAPGASLQDAGFWTYMSRF
jgi:hypothetical protein